MAEEKYTRCPECRTVYRVTGEQLAQRGGRVRCGHCQVVFDGVAELVAPAAPEAFTGRDQTPPGPQSLSPPRSFAPQAPEPSVGQVPWAEPPVEAAADKPREAGMEPASHAGDGFAEVRSPDGGPPDATVTDAMLPEAEAAVEPVALPASAEPAEAMEPVEPGASAEPGEPGEPGDRAEPAMTAPEVDAEPPSPAAADESPAPMAPPAATLTASGRGARVFAAAAVLLALLLPAQATFHFREAIAARWPAASPLIHQACQALGCKVGAPREVADLAIQASDLQADPAHQGLLILTATIRNRGAVPLAYPYLELTLTDAQDQVVVRRALTPAEYVGGTVDLARGIPANSDVAVKLFIDASATTQAGYRLFLFYG
jgi:predicted Zn finger-like uncharacterized protein